MAVARKLKATLLGPFAAEALCMSQVPAIRDNLARLDSFGGLSGCCGLFSAKKAGCRNTAAFRCSVFRLLGVERQRQHQVLETNGSSDFSPIPCILFAAKGIATNLEA